jgi:hypothetical protein
MEADLSADMAGLAFIGASLEWQRASPRMELYRGRKAICLGASAETMRGLDQRDEQRGSDRADRRNLAQ